MNCFAGLDVSLEETSVCIVDHEGKIVREIKVATDPDALCAALADHANGLVRAGVEASSLGVWVHRELQDRRLPMITVEARHMRQSLSAMRNLGPHDPRRKRGAKREFRRARNAPLAGPREQDEVRHLLLPFIMDESAANAWTVLFGSGWRACDGHRAEHGATHWSPPESAPAGAMWKSLCSCFRRRIGGEGCEEKRNEDLTIGARLGGAR